MFFVTSIDGSNLQYGTNKSTTRDMYIISRGKFAEYLIQHFVNANIHKLMNLPIMHIEKVHKFIFHREIVKSVWTDIECWFSLTKLLYMYKSIILCYVQISKLTTYVRCAFCCFFK